MYESQALPLAHRTQSIQVAGPSINIHESSDLAFWTARLGCTEEQLRIAVATVGQHTDDLCNHFGAVRFSS
jgi:hypothetical protein